MSILRSLAICLFCFRAAAFRKRFTTSETDLAHANYGMGELGNEAEFSGAADKDMFLEEEVDDAHPHHNTHHHHHHHEKHGHHDKVMKAQGHKAPAPETTTSDPWTPNCKGQDWDCLTNRNKMQVATGDIGGVTYNNFAMSNVGFCKMQNLGEFGRNPKGRSDTLGPKLLVDGLVSGGVGVSQAQFGGGGFPDGQLSCGMCIEAHADFKNLNRELTERRNGTTKTLLLIVMDQCKDDWTTGGRCPTGHLDLDIYRFPGGLNLINATWRAVECPVANHNITIAFNGKNNEYYFGFYLFDLRVPVTSVVVKCDDGSWSQELDFVDGNGFQYSGKCKEKPVYPHTTFNITSVYGETISADVEIPVHTKQSQTLVETTVQFKQSRKANLPTPGKGLYPDD